MQPHDEYKYQVPNSEPKLSSDLNSSFAATGVSKQPERLSMSELDRIFIVQDIIEKARQDKLASQPQTVAVHPLMRAFNVLLTTDNQVNRLTEADLIDLESRVGGNILDGASGKTSEGMERRFFYYDRDNNDGNGDWFFISTVTLAGKTSRAVTRYQVHNNGVLKSNDGKGHGFLTGDELENFVRITELYESTVLADIYQQTTKSEYDLAA